MALSSDGKLLATRDDAGIAVFNTATGKKEYELREKESLDAGLSPDGTMLAYTIAVKNSAGTVTEQSMNVVKIAADRILLNTRIPEQQRSLEWSADNRVLASGGGSEIQLSDLVTRKPKLKFSAPSGTEIWNFKLSPLGDVLVAICAGVLNRGDEVVVCWSSASGRERWRLDRSNKWVSTLAFTPDGNSIAVAGPSEISLLSVDNGKTYMRTADVDATYFRSLAFSPDGKRLVASKNGKSIGVWDLPTGRQVAKHQGHSDGVDEIAFNPGGTALFSSSSADGTVRLWNVPRAAELWVKSALARGAIEPMFDVDSRSLLVAGFGNDFVALLDARTGKTLCRYYTQDQHEGGDGESEDAIAALGLSRKRGLVEAISLTVPQRCFVRNRWDLTTGKRVDRKTTKLELDGAGYSFAWTRDLQLHLTSAGSVRRLKDGKELFRVYPSDFPEDLEHESRQALAPDGRTFAALSYVKAPPNSAFPYACAGVRSWEMATGKAAVLIRTTGPPRAIRFSSRGRFVGIIDSRGDFALFDSGTGGRVAEHHDFGAAAESLAFSPNGTSMATGLDNGNILLWSMPPAGDLDRTAGALDKDWEDLGAGDAARGQRAVWSLVRRPRAAVALLSSRLKTAAGVDRVKLRSLVRALDDRAFKVRDRAFRELREMGAAAQPEILELLAAPQTPGTRVALKQLRTELESSLTPDELRSVRAVEVLEAIASPEARSLLQTLASGNPVARQTIEATASLERLVETPAPGR